MALDGKTVKITAKFDGDGGGLFKEVDRVNAKTKELQGPTAGFAKALEAIKLEQVKQAFGALGAELGGTVKAMADAAQHGIAMGAVFGPMGAAIGGVAGALVGLVRSTNAQTEAEKRAAEAAKKHADELQRIIDGETKIRGMRRGAREATEIGEEELNQARLTATRLGLGPDAPDVERARRVLREAQAEREALNRADGVIWLEQRKRELERINTLKDIEAAQRKGTITAEEAQRRLKELNKTEVDSLDVVGRYKQKQQETAETVERLNRALRAGQIDAKAYEELLRATDEEYRKRAEERERREADARQRARQRAEEERKRISLVAKERGDLLVAQLEAEVAAMDRESVASPLGGPVDYTAGISTDEIARRQIVANDNLLIQRQAMAEALQREIDLQREYANVVGSAYESIVSGSAGALSTFKSLAKQQLLALGVREAVEAASQFGYGLGALANPLFAGAASLHFASAAKHAAAAGLAGVGVAAVGALGGGGGGGSAAAAGGASAGVSGSGGGATRTQTITNYIIVGDSHADDSPRMEQNNLRRRAALAEGRTSASRAE